jgi:hypothetical protein
MLVRRVLLVFASASPAFAQSCFEALPDLPTGAGPVAAAVADLDGDGFTDVGAPAATARRLSVHWNQGAGTFGGPITTFDTDPNPSWLGLADFDGDLDLDIVHANAFGVNTVTVRRNLGARTFGSPEVLSVSAHPEDGVLLDLEPDGDVDITVACSGAGTGGTSFGVLLRNQGTGTFALEPLALAGPRRIAAADFGGDGDIDLAIVRTGESRVWILRNHGQGGFQSPPISLELDGEALSVEAGRWDPDSLGDLAIGLSVSRIAILRGIAGGVAGAVYVPSPHDAYELQAADLDADGDLDLLAAGGASNSSSSFANAGDGTFALAGTTPGGGFTASVASGDLDHDGDGDLVLPISSAGVLRVLFNCSSTGVLECFGDGSATPCPCGNASPPSDRSGCLNSLGTGGLLRAAGTARLAADTLALRGASMPNAPALYFQGTTAIQGGAGSVLGDGLRCAGGSVTRLGVLLNVAGASQLPTAARHPCRCWEPWLHRVSVSMRLGTAMRPRTARRRPST